MLIRKGLIFGKVRAVQPQKMEEKLHLNSSFQFPEISIAAFSLWHSQLEETWSSYRIQQIVVFDVICKEVELIKFTFINQLLFANGTTILWNLWDNKNFLLAFKRQRNCIERAIRNAA